jgi:hypothetical protein
VHLIQNQPTQANYVDALTVPGEGWEEIAVNVLDVPVVMRVLARNGAYADEMLVDAGQVLTLRGVGGVQFKTNPALPNTPGRIYAYARRKGEPSFGVPAPRSLSSIVGPLLFQGTTAVASALTTSIFSLASIPANWQTVFLRVLTAGDPAGWHFTATWKVGGANGQTTFVYDFYCRAAAPDSSAALVLPVFGDTLILQAIHHQGAAKNITVQAYLSNLPAFQVWGFGAKTILAHVEAQAIAASGSTTINLPFYAGPAFASFFQQGPSTKVTAEIQGLDDAPAPAKISRPWNSGPQPANTTPTAISLAQFTLAPHINNLLITNNDAANATTVFCTVGVPA